MIVRYESARLLQDGAINGQRSYLSHGSCTIESGALRVGLQSLWCLGRRVACIEARR
jgi:hypothetical protein